MKSWVATTLKHYGTKYHTQWRESGEESESEGEEDRASPTTQLPTAVINGEAPGLAHLFPARHFFVSNFQLVIFILFGRDRE